MEELKEGWRKVKLLDYYEVTNGLSKNKSEFGFGYPFLTFKEVFNNYFLPENLVNLANSTVKEREKCSIKRGDIFITRTSETMEELGITAVALKDYPNATFNGFTKRLRPKSHVEISPEFISFYLKSKEFRNQIQSFSSLTTRASLNNEMLEKLELIIPDMQKQKEIAKILKNLYDKIEINNEMNKTLEEMAQTLFKRWFIDFDFPNENGEPYRSSGGKMVDSELGEIPEGWKIGKIGDLIRVQNGYAFKSKDFLEKGTVGIIKIKNISDRKVDINKSDFISEELAKAIDKKFFIQSSSILIAMTGAEVGKVGIVPEHNKKLYLNQRVGKFEELINGGKEFSYFYLNKEETQELIIAKSAGSAQPNISSKGIEELKIVLPSIKLLSEFEKNIGKSLKKIALNLNEINILTEIRDTLLPKLMSGEIEM